MRGFELGERDHTVPPSVVGALEAYDREFVEAANVHRERLANAVTR